MRGMAGEKRSALIIANSQYEDALLRQLVAKTVEPTIGKFPSRRRFQGLMILWRIAIATA